MKGHTAMIRPSGFTMIELSVGIVIAMIIMFMGYRFMTNTRFQFMHGTVNLQNLQEARLAINILRRDFSSACPFIAPDDTAKALITLRKKPFNKSGWANSLKSKPVQVDDTSLLFYRFDYETQDGKAQPKVDEVKYTYDATTKTLTRFLKGKPMVFKGIEGVKFRVFLDEYNGRVPILWVKLLAHEGKEKAGTGQDLGKPLEINTCIVSSFMNDYYSNQVWNFDVSYQK